MGVVASSPYAQVVAASIVNPVGPYWNDLPRPLTNALEPTANKLSEDEGEDSSRNSSMNNFWSSSES